MGELKTGAEGVLKKAKAIEMFCDDLLNKLSDNDAGEVQGNEKSTDVSGESEE